MLFSAVIPGWAVDGVIVTCGVAALALIVLVVGFIRSDDLDDCDWDDTVFGKKNSKKVRNRSPHPLFDDLFKGDEKGPLGMFSD